MAAVDPSPGVTRLRFKTAKRSRFSVASVVTGVLVSIAVAGVVWHVWQPGLQQQAGAASVQRQSKLVTVAAIAGTSSSSEQPAASGSSQDAGGRLPAAGSSSSGGDGPGNRGRGMEHANGLDAAIEWRIPRYWAEIERWLCPNMKYREYSQFPPELRSAAEHSKVEPLASFRGLGKWHVLRLLTHTASGERRTQGGDVWWVVLHDFATQARIPVRAFDEGDGTYSLAFVALNPGNYSVVLRLFYTSCAGFQDPFEGFDRKLEANGNTTAYCFDGGKVVLPEPLVVIPEGQLAPLPGDASAADAAAATAAAGAKRFDSGTDVAAPLPGLVLRPDHYVYRAGPLGVNDTTLGLQWRREARAATRWRLAAGPDNKRFVTWGDSTAKRCWENLLALARFPCRFNTVWTPRMHLEHYRDINFCKPAKSGESDPPLETALQGCTAGLPWASVPVATNLNPEYYEGAVRYGLDGNLSHYHYNDTFARQLGLAPVPKEFTVVAQDGWGMRPISPHMEVEVAQWGPTDAVLVHVGAHAVRLLSYADWKVWIDGLAALLVASPAQIVWRTSMPFAEHVFRHRNASTFFSAAHFQNEPRRILFDSYAEFRMRASGIRVWDITAYGGAGSYRPTDMFHMDGMTMRWMNLDLAESILC